MPEINANSSIEDIIEELTARAVGTSETQLLSYISAVKPGSDFDHLIVAAVVAAMTTKRVVTSRIEQSKLKIPDSVMIGDTVNMKVLATIGHLFMTLPEDDLSKIGKAAKEKYKKSIGNVSNITMFSNYGDGPGTRTTILRAYRDKIIPYKLNEFHQVFKSKGGSFVRKSMIGSGSPISKVLLFFPNMIWEIIKRVFSSLSVILRFMIVYLLFMTFIGGLFGILKSCVC